MENKEQSKSFEYAISLIEGKWKMNILYHLKCNEILRYGELKRVLVGITHKMLSKQLKELESDGLIIRKEYQQIPPKVEYSISKKGQTMMPILMQLCEWGKKNLE